MRQVKLKLRLRLVKLQVTRQPQRAKQTLHLKSQSVSHVHASQRSQRWKRLLLKQLQLKRRLLLWQQKRHQSQLRL